MEKTNQAFTSQTTQYRHCLQSIFHKGAPRGEGIKEGEKRNLFNPVKESAERMNEQDLSRKSQLIGILSLGINFAFNLRLHCQVSSLFYILIPSLSTGPPTPTPSPHPSLFHSIHLSGLAFSLLCLSFPSPFPSSSLDPFSCCFIESLSLFAFSCTEPPSSLPSS